MATTYGRGRYRVLDIDLGFGEAATGTPFFFLQVRVLRRYAADGGTLDCPCYERTAQQYLGSDAGARILRDSLRPLGVESPT